MKPIIIGRPTRSGRYSYVVYNPERNEALEAEAPPLHYFLSVQTRRGDVLYLRKIIYVKYTRRDEPTPLGSFIQIADYSIESDEDVAAFLGRAEKRPVKIEVVDEGFIVNIYRLTGAANPKVALATQIAVPIRDDDDTTFVLVPLGEAWLFLEENPEAIREQVLYGKLPFFVVEEMSKDDFREEIAERYVDSLRAFERMTRLAMFEAAAEEEAE